MKKQISPVMIASRIVSHGIINGNVKNGIFSLKGLPFTIYMRPKAATNSIDEVLTAQLFAEDVASPAPFPIYDWSPMYISRLQVPESITNVYDVYWGTGYNVTPEDIELEED